MVLKDVSHVILIDNFPVENLKFNYVQYPLIELYHNYPMFGMCRLILCCNFILMYSHAIYIFYCAVASV